MTDTFAHSQHLNQETNEKKRSTLSLWLSVWLRVQKQAKFMSAAPFTHEAAQSALHKDEINDEGKTSN